MFSYTLLTHCHCIIYYRNNGIWLFFISVLLIQVILISLTGIEKLFLITLYILFAQAIGKVNVTVSETAFFYGCYLLTMALVSLPL